MVQVEIYDKEEYIVKFFLSSIQAREFVNGYREASAIHGRTPYVKINGKEE
jgi:hypothetical protein